MTKPCPYCGGPRRASARAILENPFCENCLHERMEEAARTCENCGANDQGPLDLVTGECTVCVAEHGGSDVVA